jgi:hypothetical protein
MSVGIFFISAALTAALYRSGVPDEIRNAQATVVG